jgi:hypothetical protein
MRVLALGDQVDGTIHLDGHLALFTARVAWAQACDARLGLLGRMGLCFVRIDPAFASALGPIVPVPSAPPARLSGSG